MASKITEEQKLQMNILYLSLHTYAGVAREMGVSATTVKKYIIPDFELPQQNIEKINIELPSFNVEVLRQVDWNDCTVYANEYNEIRELWKEITI